RLTERLKCEELPHALIELLSRIERRELRDLRHEVLVVDRLEWILVRELREQHLQQVAQLQIGSRRCRSRGYCRSRHESRSSSFSTQKSVGTRHPHPLPAHPDVDRAFAR